MIKGLMGFDPQTILPILSLANNYEVHNASRHRPNGKVTNLGVSFQKTTSLLHYHQGAGRPEYIGPKKTLKHHGSTRLLLSTTRSKK